MCIRDSTLGTLPPAIAALTPILAPIFVEVTSVVVLTGISPMDFNNDPQQQEAFAQAILASLPTEYQDAEVTDIVARIARRRRLQDGVEVSYTIVVQQDAVIDGGGGLLGDATAALAAAVKSGAFLQTLIEAAAVAGSSAVLAFQSMSVDEAATLAAIATASITVVVATPRAVHCCHAVRCAL